MGDSHHDISQDKSSNGKLIRQGRDDEQSCDGMSLDQRMTSLDALLDSAFRKYDDGPQPMAFPKTASMGFTEINVEGTKTGRFSCSSSILNVQEERFLTSVKDALNAQQWLDMQPVNTPYAWTNGPSMAAQIQRLIKNRGPGCLGK